MFLNILVILKTDETVELKIKNDTNILTIRKLSGASNNLSFDIYDNLLDCQTLNYYNIQNNSMLFELYEFKPEVKSIEEYEKKN